MNMLQNGLKWLSAKQKWHVSSRVVYHSDDVTFEVDAVLGTTRYETTDDYGLKISAHATDFLISGDELKIVPKVGDRIVYDGVTHEVLEIDEKCWRWCDPHGITKRIHTKAL